MRRSLRVDQLENLPADAAGELPLDSRPQQARRERTLGRGHIEHDARPPGKSENRTEWPRPASAYVARYVDGGLSPVEVVKRAASALDELAARTPTMNVVTAKRVEIAMKEAEAARARYASGRPLGPLDGVPILVKDEHDVAGLPTRLGSRVSSDAPAAKDATLVARLRAAGAIVMGKAVMTEWGLSPLGQNIQVPMPHNPHGALHAAGGSSTGSAVAVALGLGPLATGGDAGGSIRIPAALNGLFGIKPTFGRVSRKGGHIEGSAAHSGPLACSTRDLALFLDLVSSQPDPSDPLTEMAISPPPGGFGAWLAAGVKGLRIGIVEADWGDADAEVARVARNALGELEKAGAVLVPVEIPLARLAGPMGYITFGLEMLAQVWEAYQTVRERIGEEVRLPLAALSRLGPTDYLRTQRVRARLRAECARALGEVDVLAWPTTAITAPRYTEADAKHSFSDPTALDGVCRYVFLANLTGLPAGSAPVGNDSKGLPIGLQIVGDAWDEATVLACLSALERRGVAVVKRPIGAYDLLH
jgi:aspartyl-tRNA(Asn)/glutamyl-tRNA(Gln) amidotransferase subunit A